MKPPGSRSNAQRPSTQPAGSDNLPITNPDDNPSTKYDLFNANHPEHKNDIPNDPNSADNPEVLHITQRDEGSDYQDEHSGEGSENESEDVSLAKAQWVAAERHKQMLRDRRRARTRERLVLLCHIHIHIYIYIISNAVSLLCVSVYPSVCAQ